MKKYPTPPRKPARSEELKHKPVIRYHSYEYDYEFDGDTETYEEHKPDAPVATGPDYTSKKRKA